MEPPTELMARQEHDKVVQALRAEIEELQGRLQGPSPPFPSLPLSAISALSSLINIILNSSSTKFKSLRFLSPPPSSSPPPLPPLLPLSSSLSLLLHLLHFPSPNSPRGHVCLLCARPVGLRAAVRPLCWYQFASPSAKLSPSLPSHSPQISFPFPFYLLFLPDIILLSEFC